MSVRAWVAIVLVSIQLSLLALIVASDRGFTLQDASNAIAVWCMWVGIYLAFLIFSVAFALMLGEFRIAAVQLAVPVTLALGIWADIATDGWTEIPKPPDFQGALDPSQPTVLS